MTVARELPGSQRIRSVQVAVNLRTVWTEGMRAEGVEDVLEAAVPALGAV
jgi:hypothetical protein